MKRDTGVRDIEWRGIPLACFSLGALAVAAGERAWWAVVAAGAVVALTCTAVGIQRLRLRGVLLAAGAVLFVLPVLYMFALLPPFGVVLAWGVALAAWGAARAFLGRRGIPHPLG